MRIDRIFEAPVELANRTFNIPAEQAVPGNHIYDRYVAGVHWMEAGALLFIGGLASAVAGTEIGGSTALAGVGLTYLGGMRVAYNVGRLREHSR